MVCKSCGSCCFRTHGIQDLPCQEVFVDKDGNREKCGGDMKEMEEEPFPEAWDDDYGRNFQASLTPVR